MSAIPPPILLRRKATAFSLLEMVVSLVVVAVLFVLGIAAISKARDFAGNARCVSNLRQLGGAIIAYSTDHNGTLPPGRNYTDGVKYWFMDRNMWAYHYLGRDVSTARLFRCPFDKFITDHKNYYNYTWNVNFLVDLRTPDDPKIYLREALGKVLMADGAGNAERTGIRPESGSLEGPGPIHSGSKSAPNLSKRHKEGANCLMGDGSVRWFRDKEILTPGMLNRL